MRTLSTTINPKKSLGQNFLVNEQIYHFMAKEIASQPGETIIEVGPGEGILTEHLAKSEAQILAIEKDRRLVPILKEKFKNQKNVTIVEGDALKLKFTGKSAIRPTLDPRLAAREFSSGCMADLPDFKVEHSHYKIAGNIPYYLTSHLLKIILEEWPKPKLILFMVQKEVAERIIAKPPRMNLLALAVQLFAEAKILKKVSKNNFRPIPKVDSALIKIIPKSDYQLPTINYKLLFKLARAAFGNKRKQILNSLIQNLKINTPKDFITQKLAEIKIDSTRRPETLSLEEWEKLTKAFSQEQSSD